MAAGFVLLILTSHSSTIVRYVSLVICACGVYAAIPLHLCWPSGNFGGHTKKGVAIGFIIAVSQVGGIIGGQIYREDDAPLYVRGHTINAVLMFINSILILGLKFLLRRENKRRDQLTPEEFEKESDQKDATDAHPGYRFYE
ncbi:hypothetical protein BX616_011234 [Lobosporangium transversale]|nr:hypothetical protein BX616_011234 [Lobosporangium transversale]